MNRWHILTLLLLLVGVPWIWVNRVPVAAQPDFTTPQPAVNHPAPDFTLTTLDGEQFTLSAQGTPIVLNFWATWCAPCRNEMPALQTASERFQGRVQIIGVDQGESAADVQRFVEEMGVTFPIPMDGDSTVGRLYNIQGMPTTFFIDRNGVIRHLWIGEMNSITLAEGIAEILR
jgi:cytochrome c biogenesis protein CcmG, thiol:disulfide interchange protein DsbE